MRKFKKLNRKGFTLIELLAVIVILAVVMGVAANSVLNAMNNSRTSSLQNSALSAADSFRTAYADYSLSTDKKLLGVVDTGSAKNIENLLKGTPVSLNVFKDGLNITAANYDLGNSWVYFNSSDSSFKVCLVANKTGNYYVASAVGKKTYTDSTSPVKKAMTSTTMWACSDNTNSWTA